VGSIADFRQIAIFIVDKVEKNAIGLVFVRFFACKITQEVMDGFGSTFSDSIDYLPMKKSLNFYQPISVTGILGV